MFLSTCLDGVRNQHANKVMSDSPGLVDFAIGLVNSVLNLPNREIPIQKNCNQSCSSKSLFGLIKMTLELVHASCNLPEWQAVKLAFFSPWEHTVQFLLPCRRKIFHSYKSPQPLSNEFKLMCFVCLAGWH